MTTELLNGEEITYHQGRDTFQIKLYTRTGVRARRTTCQTLAEARRKYDTIKLHPGSIRELWLYGRCPDLLLAEQGGSQGQTYNVRHERVYHSN